MTEISKHSKSNSLNTNKNIIKSITKKSITKKSSTKNRSSKNRSSKKRSSKKRSSKKRSSKKSSTKKRSSKKNSSKKNGSKKRSSKKRSSKKKSSIKKLSNKKLPIKKHLYEHILTSAESNYKKHWIEHVPENLRSEFKSFKNNLYETSGYLGDMPYKLDIEYDDNNPRKYYKKLESLLEQDNWVGSYEILEYYEMIDTIKSLIKSDRNMKKIILIELKYVTIVISNNLKKKIPSLFR